ncbi:type I DNA topoisomerase [Candidatus Saccharibacteria bacterium]|nr:type I DNA topoisomerase [Candidatus Saccharibacteria bacterium]
MSKNLVIVESPAKAKTIEKYLGKDFKVLSSVGHIRQIPPKDKDAIDVTHGFTTKYEIDPLKAKIVAELKKAAKGADVWLATDRDREGEAIAWHLTKVLGLDPKKTKRITYQEITKSAVEDAVKHPGLINMNLVSAQQARQILDRLVGYELSPVVWKKVPGGKSAGRVQSPAVRLIVEREREIRDFKHSFKFKVSVIFKHSKDEFKAELPTTFDTEAKATAFLESLIGAKYSVADIVTSPGTRNPSAPFTTSTLQQEANARLGYSAKTTMSAAQKLYQAGKITYMRTDSTNLSGQAINAMSKFIVSEYGEKYSQVRQFKTKTANAQEAHEAIRPTDVKVTTVTGSYEQKIYTLIRNRALASQMATAQLEKTTIKIAADSSSTTCHPELVSGASTKKILKQVQDDDRVYFESKGEVVIFDGFLKVYGKDKDNALPKLTSGDKLNAKEVLARQTFDKAPARYTEGSLVKKLEELGIGRPSTYATILENIQARGYVQKGISEGKEREVVELRLGGSDLASARLPKNGEVVSDESRNDGHEERRRSNDLIRRDIITESTGADKGKLVPNAIGEVLSDFLLDYFNQIVDYGFTAETEEDLDKIEQGTAKQVDMLQAFYTPFHKLIEKSDSIDRSKVVKARKIGIDPKSKKPVFARVGRFGPMLQIGEKEDAEKPRFAPLPADTTVHDVTLKQALEMFKLPRVVGKTDDNLEIKANIGRFGPYIQVDKLFVSIAPLDPFTITLDEAKQLYKEKLTKEANKNIADFGTIKVLNGRFGPYVTDGKKNAKIPKDIDPKKLTEVDAKKLLDETPAKKKFPRRKAKK